jgi:hypothetical protein
MNCMRGQSLVEFSVGCTLLALLFVGTLALVDMQDTQRRTLVAARQAGFEQMWLHGRGEEMQARLQAAHFDPNEGADRFVSGMPLRTASLVMESRRGALPGTTATASEVLLRPLQAAGGFLGSNFDLDTGGFQAVTVRSSLQRAPEWVVPFDALPLTMQHTMTLVADGWNAGSATHVGQRTSGLVPTSAMRSVSNLWRTLAAPLALVEPNLDQLCLGLIEPERVPEDRLGAGTTALPGDCR